MALDILLFLVGIVLAAMTLLDVFETVVVPGGSRASLKVARRIVFVLLPICKMIRGKRHGLALRCGNETNLRFTSPKLSAVEEL